MILSSRQAGLLQLDWELSYFHVFTYAGVPLHLCYLTHLNLVNDHLSRPPQYDLLSKAFPNSFYPLLIKQLLEHRPQNVQQAKYKYFITFFLQKHLVRANYVLGARNTGEQDR